MYPGVELRLLRYVVVLSEELNYGRAAQRLHTAQPSLSKQILRLEQDLGFKLFRRNRRWVEVTPAGQRFIEEARKALHYAQQAVERAKKADREEQDTLIVGYSAFIDLHFVSAVRQMKALTLGQGRPTFKSSNTAEIIAKLLSHEWQAGLVILPIVENELTVTPLLQEAIAVALPESHPLARKRQVGLRDLRDESLVLPSLRFNPHFHDYLIAQFRSKEFTPAIAQEVTSPHEALHLVSDGAGVALAQASVLINDRKGVTVRQLTDTSLTVQVGLAFHRENDSAILTAFKEAVVHIRDAYIAHAERISSKSA